jgi:hypothetical protein
MIVITHESAVNMARWFAQQKVEASETNALLAMGLNAALSSNVLDDLFREMERMGFRLCADEKNPTVRTYLASRAVVKDETLCP